MQIIYLYGFASGPLSEKARFFEHKFDLIGIPFQIFDFIPSAENFRRMKPSQLVIDLHKYIKEKFANTKVILFGSSYGGLIVAWYTALYPEHVEKLILMAPALKFTPEFIAETLGTTLPQWKEEGVALAEHFRFMGEIPLDYSFVQDLYANPPPKFSSTQFPISTLIFHGKNDAVVPVQWSIDFAFDNTQVTLSILEGDHQLLNQKQLMWNSIQSFLAS